MSMTLRQAIQKAIDGGWKYNFSVYSLGYRVLDENTPNGFVDYPIVGIFDDPLFWQSLGKATGWKIKCQNCGGEIGESTGMGKVVFKYQCKGKCGSYFDNREAEVWAKEWHRFIDHLADGGTIDGFFEGFE